MNDKPWEILQGDVRKILKTLPENYFDAVLSDPPYGLAFMGKRWDYFLPSVNVWADLLRVVKPGAHAMIFGGSRTSHRLAVNVEDGGFEIRDTLLWLHGQGFPKSKNLGDGYGTQLKPSFEPIILARKYLDGTAPENIAKWGVGGLAIDASRISPNLSTSGRWPANVLMDKEAGELLDGQSGIRATSKPGKVIRRTNKAKSTTYNMTGEPVGTVQTAYGDVGGAARFFYTPKADTLERKGNDHPTVKPIDLCRHFARLILPLKNGKLRRILVPFSGSGSEIIGALQAGWDEVTGIEIDRKYIKIAETRIRTGGVFSTLHRGKR